MGHNGDLAHDSPALFGALKRVFCDGDDSHSNYIKLLEKVYSASVANGALEEVELTREPEASYNPRPARVCQILLKEVGESDPAVLAAAMLCCATRLPAHEIVAGSHKLFSLVAEYPKDVLSAVERVKLALLIDDIRHIHRSTRPRSEISRILSSAIELVSNSPNPENDRLRIVARAAIENIQELLGVSID